MMQVNLENAYVCRSGKGNPMLVANNDGLFKVYWCDKIKHYKIKELGKYENQGKK